MHDLFLLNLFRFLFCLQIYDIINVVLNHFEKEECKINAYQTFVRKQIFKKYQ